MLWSMVSNAADRSSRQIQDIFCDPIALIRIDDRGCRQEQFQWNGVYSKRTDEGLGGCSFGQMPFLTLTMTNITSLRLSGKKSREKSVVLITEPWLRFIISFKYYLSSIDM